MKVLVTGAEGMLGKALVRELGFDEVIGMGRDELDITDPVRVRAVLENQTPDVIIHAAADTAVDAAEEDPDRAFRINTLGTQNLVNCCIGKETRFVFISSTGIYGRKKTTAYTEFDTPEPTTVHHRSKYEAEKIVRAHLERFLILRTGWLYGGSIHDRKNFVYRRFLEAKEKPVIYSDDSQSGNPTYVGNLARQIEALLGADQYGLFNCVDRAEGVSRYRYVKRIVEHFDLPCSVERGDAGMFKRSAPVSPNESARNYKLDLLGLNVMEEWDTALGRYISQLKADV